MCRNAKEKREETNAVEQQVDELLQLLKSEQSVGTQTDFKFLYFLNVLLTFVSD